MGVLEKETSMIRIAGIATITGREESLKDTVASLANQVDYVHVFDGNEAGDCVKFSAYQKNCFYFSCDDDLIYPKDYCAQMIQCYNRNKGAIITAHGKIFSEPFIGFHHKSNKKFHCLHSVAQDVKVDCGGTGVMLLAGQLSFQLSYLTEKNMSDVWISKFAKEQGVPIICMSHGAGWIKHNGKVDVTKTIYHDRKNNHEKENEIVRQMLRTP